MIVLAAIGAVATIRLLRLPWWWLLFPPFVDGVWNGNPQTLLVPLILVGAGPIAAFLKIYALVPLVLTLRWRALLVTRSSCCSSPRRSCRGRSYIAQFGDLSAALATQSDGGLSATALPVADPDRASSPCSSAGRERPAWLAVPVLWPATQWYYSTLALPALTPIAAALIAVPIPGFAVVAAVVVAVERRNTDPRAIGRRLATGGTAVRRRRRRPERRPAVPLGILGRP